MVQKRQKAAEVQKQQPPVLFALDIGTRSVIGLVVRLVDEKLEILEYAKQEYNSRAMIDGQIENIDKVSRCIVDVKTQLENKLGVALNQVAIAAAGRALRTCQLTIQCVFKAGEVIGADLLRNIEMEGIIQAQKKVMAENAESGQEFYCVGHTVTGYVLDGYEMHEVLGHRGSHCEVTMIAAFLPKLVVESLYSAIEYSNLEVMSLTLEPIAAMNIVIPPDLRMLNLALVDIGAGTSDIALSRDGTVVAYDMVTVAGDEVTEAIMRSYLVDFTNAEMIKKGLMEQAEISFTDILGFEQTVSSAEVQVALRPVIEQLAAEVAEKIVALNGAAPAALFLVGGGSLYPGLPDIFAEKLQMDQKRVAVGGKSHYKKVIHDCPGINTPEYITPVGIALTASQQDNQYFATVLVNGKSIRQFRFEGMKVSDVLILAGQYKYHQLVGTIGKPLRFTLNDQVQTISGGLSKPASIRLNGRKATMDTLVKANDEIEVKPAIKGKDAHRTVGQIFKNKYGYFSVTYNGRPYQAGFWVSREGEILAADTPILDGDVLMTEDVTTLTAFLAYYQLPDHDGSFMINDMPAALDDPLAANDQIVWETLTIVAKEDEPLAVETGTMLPDPIEAEAEAATKLVVPQEEFTFVETVVQPVETGNVEMQENVTGEAQSAIQHEVTTKVTEDVEPALMIQLNGRSLPLPPRTDGPYMLFDLLNYVDDTMLLLHGKVTTCLLNGEAQPFTTLLTDGDQIVIQ